MQILPSYHYQFSAFITAVSSLSLVILVFTKGTNKTLTKQFILYYFSLFFWALGVFLCTSVYNYKISYFFNQLTHVAAILIPVFFLHFTLIYLGRLKNFFEKALLAFFYLTALFFEVIVIFFSSFFFMNLVPKLSFPFFPTAGPFYTYWVISFSAAVLVAHIILLLELINSSGIRKKQISFFLLANMIGYSGGVGCFLPVYNLSFFPFPYGPYGVFLLSLVSGYAILRHQLFDLQIFIKKTIVFAVLFGSIMAIFSFILFIFQNILNNYINPNPFLTTSIAVGFIVFSHDPIKSFLISLTDQFLFQKKYDYKELLKVFTNEILTVLDLQELTNRTIVGLNNIIKLESSSVLLHDKESKSYRVVASFGLKYKDLIFREDDALISYINATHQPIQRDTHSDKLEGHSELKEDFVKLNARLCLPLILHDELLGVLTLGMKKSGEDYNQEDLDILGSLARTEAIAISNARLFDELSKTQAEAAQREKMAVIGTLAAGINHEICNPLGIIRGQCEMFLLNIRDGFYKEKSQEEIMNIFMDISAKVIKEADRATGITKRLSTFAKPSKRSDFEEVIIDKEIEEVLGLIEHDLNLNNIEVIRNFPKSFPSILADRKQIEEVFFNIIRNAAQAMDKKEGRIVVSGLTEKNSVVIRIVDNGSGIPQEKLNQIFHPFYTTKAPGKGTGLGLFIVKQIVEKNKGEISVESEVGVGTTFILKFPAGVSALAA